MRLRRVLQFDPADIVLFLHFFREFFESDLLSVRDRLNTVLASIAALLASFGLMLPVLFNHKYRALNALPDSTLYHGAALADKLMFICLSMGVTSAVTLLNWQSLFPDVRDFLILVPLPLRRLQLFRAKFLALLAFLTLLIVAVNILPSFSLTAIMSGRWQQPSNSFLQIASLFAACCSAGYFAFFTLLAVQACLLNLLPSEWFSACSLAIQGLLLVCTCAALPLVFWIPGLHSFIGAQPPALRWIPPAWFLGLGESMLGAQGPVMLELAHIARRCLLAVVGFSLLFYAVTYARNTDRLLKTPAMKQSHLAARCLSRVLNLLTRVPEEAAMISFTIKSLFRSRVHKLLVAGIVGACAALVLDGFTSMLIGDAFHHRAIQRGALLKAAFSAPLIVAYFLLSGLLFVFSIPVELRANWIFRLSDVQGRYSAISSTETILLSVVILPVSGFTMFALACWIGLTAALVQSVFVLLMCLVLLQCLLWNWNRIPFTSPYLPGKHNVVQSALVFAVALSIFAYFATTLELVLVKSVLGTAVLFAVLSATYACMQRQRRRSWSGSLLIRFDDAPEPEVQTLELGGE